MFVCVCERERERESGVEYLCVCVCVHERVVWCGVFWYIYPRLLFVVEYFSRRFSCSQSLVFRSVQSTFFIAHWAISLKCADDGRKCKTWCL